MPAKKLPTALPFAQSLPQAKPAPARQPLLLTAPKPDAIQELNLRATTMTFVLSQILEPHSIPHGESLLND